MIDAKKIEEIQSRMVARANGYRGGASLMSSTGWDACFDDFETLIQYIRDLNVRIEKLEMQHARGSADTSQDVGK